MIKQVPVKVMSRSLFVPPFDTCVLLSLCFFPVSIVSSSSFFVVEVSFRGVSGTSIRADASTTEGRN